MRHLAAPAKPLPAQPRQAHRRAFLGLSLGFGLASPTAACAQLSSETEVRLIPHPDPARAPPPRAAEEFISRTITAIWEQDGDRLDVTLTEHRRCKTLTMVSMIREERTTRTLDAGVYWEFGIAALTAAVATYAFVRPEAFSRPLINADGQIIRDPSAGYTSGGIFSGIAALSLGSGIYDTVRARDSIAYSDGEARIEGPEAPCHPPERPWSRRTIGLIVDDRPIATTMTDGSGRATFTLPQLDASSADATGHIRGSIRADDEHAVAVDLLRPEPATEGPAAPPEE